MVGEIGMTSFAYRDKLNFVSVHLCELCVPDYTRGTNICEETLPVYASLQDALKAGWWIIDFAAQTELRNSYKRNPQYLCPECSKAFKPQQKEKLK